MGQEVISPQVFHLPTTAFLYTTTTTTTTTTAAAATATAAATTTTNNNNNINNNNNNEQLPQRLPQLQQQLQQQQQQQQQRLQQQQRKRKEERNEPPEGANVVLITGKQRERVCPSGQKEREREREIAITEQICELATTYIHPIKAEIWSCRVLFTREFLRYPLLLIDVTVKIRMR